MSNIKYSSLYKTIFELMELPDNAVIADLGCRDASFLLGFEQAFPNKIKSAIGVDISDRGFKNIEYKNPIELKVMNCAGKLEFDDNSFNFVFSKDMFECVSDKEFLVSEIYRILKPNGIVICVNCDWDGIAYNGENKELITKAIHAYAETKQPWMDDLDSWIGRRMYGFFSKSKLFESCVSVHNVIETEYKVGTFGYDLSLDIAWLHEENTGALTREEYDQFIACLQSAQKEGSYIFSKPYYIYKGIKK
ncbi:MAG: methyltransferase domain-containing protein [Oscillospiraceae bacterium]|nr:methyltransferase domain-containing protein [Oscillospiraceae bacterium]